MIGTFEPLRDPHRSARRDPAGFLFGRRKPVARRSIQMFEYRQALMRLHQSSSEREIARSKLMGRAKLRGRALFDHFFDERLDEFDVDKWNLGVDQPSFTFEFR